MMRYSIAHMKPDGAKLYLNGGRLQVSGEEIVVMYGSREVARMDMARTKVEKLTHGFFYRRVRISDSAKGVEILFFPWTARKFCADFGI